MDVKLLLLKTDSLKFKRKRNWDLLIFLYFVLNVKQRRNRTSHQIQHMTEQQAYLYSLTNRAKGTVRLVPAICRVEFVYVCGFVCVRMCMGVPGDCCLCFCICLAVPSRRLMRWEFLSANHIIPR